MGNEHGAGYRLDQKVVGPQIEDAGHDGWLIQGREDEDRNAAESPHGLADLPAIHIRHHEVQNHQPRRLVLDQAKALDAAISRQHIETVGRQKYRKQVRNGRIVVNRQHKWVHRFAQSYYPVNGRLGSLQVIYRLE